MKTVALCIRVAAVKMKVRNLEDAQGPSRVRLQQLCVVSTQCILRANFHRLGQPDYLRQSTKDYGEWKEHFRRDCVLGKRTGIKMGRQDDEERRES